MIEVKFKTPKNVKKSKTMVYIHAPTEVSDGSELDIYAYTLPEIKQKLPRDLDLDDYGIDVEMLADGDPYSERLYYDRFKAFLKSPEGKRRHYSLWPKYRLFVIVYKPATGGPAHYFTLQRPDEKFGMGFVEAAKKIVNRKYPRAWSKGSKKDIPPISVEEYTVVEKLPRGVSYLKIEDTMKRASEDNGTFQFNQRSSVVDSYLSGKAASVDRDLKSLFTDSFKPGQRVSYFQQEGLFELDRAAENGTKGYVVRVHNRVAHSADDFAWVKWDDGSFGQCKKAHLLPVSASRTASSYAFSVASMDDLMEAYSYRSASTLVHKAKKDLWSFEKLGEQYVIERLFDDSGSPIKED